MSLFRGAEYNRLMEKTKNKKEALTFYDMNLSAQDHQTLFTCDGDSNREDLESIFYFYINANNKLSNYFLLQ